MENGCQNHECSDHCEVSDKCHACGWSDKEVGANTSDGKAVREARKALNELNGFVDTARFEYQMDYSKFCNAVDALEELEKMLNAQASEGKAGSEIVACKNIKNGWCQVLYSNAKRCCFQAHPSTDTK